MGDNCLRLSIGIMGNAASLLLYGAPILTFTRIVRKKSTEEFSCVPYIIALLNCLLYTWYALPVVSYRWENFPIVTINGLGILLEFSFIFIYFWYSTAAKEKIKVAVSVMLVVTVFSITALISAFVFHDHHHRKVFVGSVGLVASVSMYCSPLVVMKQVLVTKSVEFMPFYLSFFTLVSSLLWMVYGLLGHDLFLASPNMVGTPIGIFQIMLYCKYRKNKIIMEEPNKWDLEKNDEKSKQLQLVVDDNINSKS